MAYIRKKPKGFGRGAQIEGDMKPGARTLLVEDLATDGGSKVNFINAIRQAECEVAHALVVFHYGIFPQSLDHPGRSRREAAWPAPPGGMCWKRPAKPAASMPAETAKIRAFLDDPEGWSTAARRFA